MLVLGGLIYQGISSLINLKEHVIFKKGRVAAKK